MPEVFHNKNLICIKSSPNCLFGKKYISRIQNRSPFRKRWMYAGTSQPLGPCHGFYCMKKAAILYFDAYFTVLSWTITEPRVQIKGAPNSILLKPQRFQRWQGSALSLYAYHNLWRRQQGLGDRNCGTWGSFQHSLGCEWGGPLSSFLCPPLLIVVLEDDALASHILAHQQLLWSVG